MATGLRRIDPETRYVLVIDKEGNEILTSISELLDVELVKSHLSNVSLGDTLHSMLIVLKKIEYHLSISTDTNLNDQDV